MSGWEQVPDRYRIKPSHGYQRSGVARIRTVPEMRKIRSDRRLLGTWRSDRRRTLRDWKLDPERDTPEKRQLLSDLFGHLTLRFTQQRIYSDFKGSHQVVKYDVIGADSSSVAVLAWCSLYEEERIQHIHFEDDRHYWIALDGQREWFRRIKIRSR